VVLALVLASGAFAALGPNEARAEDPKLPEAQQQQPTLLTGGEPAKTDSGMVVGQKPPAEPPPAEPPPTQTPTPVDSTPPAPQPEPAPRPEVGPGISVSLENDAEVQSGGISLAFQVSDEGGFAQQNQYDAGTLPADPKNLAAPVPPAAPGVASAPAQVDSAPAPSSSSEPMPEWPVGEVAGALGEDGGWAPPLVEESLPVASRIDDAAVLAPPPEERPAQSAAPSMMAPYPAPPAPEAATTSQPLVSLGAALGSAAQNLGGVVGGVAASVLGSVSEDPSGPAPESADPLGSTTPEPTTPLPSPVGYGAFSPSAGGQASGGGSGIAPLFLCILASGLILLRRREGRLAWALDYVPKPSSALLTPLERPG
jgi:hypothetical protein